MRQGKGVSHPDMPASWLKEALAQAQQAPGPSHEEREQAGGSVTEPARPSGENGAPAAPAPVYSAARAEEVTAAERLRFWMEVESPEDEQDRELIRQIRRRIFDETEGMGPGEAEEVARQIVMEMAARVPSKQRQDRIIQEVLSTLNGKLGLIDPLMRNPRVTEIMINAPDEVWVEIDGQLERTPVKFRGDREVRALVEAIAAQTGRKFDYASPILDARLPDGSRLNAVRWPVALRGTTVTIRRFPRMFSFDDLVRMGALPPRDREMHPDFLQFEDFPTDVDVADFIRWAVKRRLNMIVSGSTSSGKTTNMNAMLELFDRRLRTVVIEDSAELQPPPDLHVVRLERRPPNVQGEGEIPLSELIKAAMRMRPDVIIVGECRKNEAAVWLEAASTGHDGSITSIHSNGPLDTLRRMVRMIRAEYPDMPSRELAEYIASAVQVVLHFKRDSSSKTGLRLIQRVAAVEGVDERGEFVLHDVYTWRDGHCVPTGYVPVWARPEQGEVEAGA